MALIQRLLNISFTLGQGAFGTDGADSVMLSNVRASAKIVRAGPPSLSQLQLAVWGMSLDQMNQLGTYGMIPNLVRKNTVAVDAGDAQSGMARVFSGTIVNAWADFQASADVPFMVSAAAGMVEGVVKAPPLSFAGPTAVADIMESLARQIGYNFQNSGVTTMLPNPYFYGSPRNQIAACAKAANINYYLDDGTLTLAIWPKNAVRNGETFTISPDNGMISYPSFADWGIEVKALFNPSVGFGQKIEIQGSSIPKANGEWYVYKLDYNLETMVPNGDWLMSIDARRPGTAVPVIK